MTARNSLKKRAFPLCWRSIAASSLSRLHSARRKNGKTASRLKLPRIISSMTPIRCGRWNPANWKMKITRSSTVTFILCPTNLYSGFIWMWIIRSTLPVFCTSPKWRATSSWTRIRFSSIATRYMWRIRWKVLFPTSWPCCMVCSIHRTFHWTFPVLICRAMPTWRRFLHISRRRCQTVCSLSSRMTVNSLRKSGMTWKSSSTTECLRRKISMIEPRILPFSPIQTANIILSKSIRRWLKITRRIRMEIWFICMPTIKMNNTAT